MMKMIENFPNSAPLNQSLLAQTEEFSSLMRDIVSETIQDGDGVEWATVEGSIGTNEAKRYRVRLTSDPETILDDIINVSGFSLQKGDPVLLYKIKNNLFNSFIIACKNQSFQSASSNSSLPLQTRQTFSLSKVENQDFIVGRNTGFFSGPGGSVGSICEAYFATSKFSSAVSWHYGQPFDYGQQIPLLGGVVNALWLSDSEANCLSHAFLTDTDGWNNNEGRTSSAEAIQRACGAASRTKERLTKRVSVGDLLLIVRSGSGGFRPVGNCSMFGKE